MPDNQNERDPIRQRILDRGRTLGKTLADMSRAVGKNEAYIHQFIHRGSPKELPEKIRGPLARYLDLPENELRHDAGPETAYSELPTASAAPFLAQVQPAGISGSSSSTSRDVPVFRDDAEIDLTRPTEWAFRPHALATSSGAFALWITASRGRLRPGDLAYVHASQPPRVGDTAVVKQGARAVCVGDLTQLDTEHVVVNIDSKQSETYDRSDIQLLKVVFVACA